jgi:hypothetical protein
MAETRNERAAAGRDRGMEELEGAKDHLAEGAERVAAAVERTAGELEGDGDEAISGFGRSVASLMRQLAGGLRERDVEEFARELGALARRNPGVFLAGSVALGFGIARFFKARVPQSYSSRDYGGQSTSDGQGSGESERGERKEVDSDESLDLSAGATRRGHEGGSERSVEGGGASQGAASESTSASQGGSSSRGSTATPQATSRDDDRTQSKSRQSSKPKVKPQRASSGGTQRTGEASHAPSTERPPADPAPAGETAGSSDSGFAGGTGGGALRGGKS